MQCNQYNTTRQQASDDTDTNSKAQSQAPGATDAAIVLSIRCCMLASQHHLSYSQSNYITLFTYGRPIGCEIIQTWTSADSLPNLTYTVPAPV